MDINRGLYPAANGGLQSANPAAGIANGSEVTSALLDDIYFELINILTAVAIAPATGNPTQVLQSLKRIFGGSYTAVTQAGGLSYDQLGFVELIGSYSYTTVLQNPQGGYTPLVMVFNNSTVTMQLAIAAGQFDGPGGTGAPTMNVAAGTLIFMRSDGANYIVQAQFAPIAGNAAQVFNVGQANAATAAAQFDQVPGGYGVTLNNVLANRALNTVYTNSNARGIFVFVQGVSAGAGFNLVILVDGQQTMIIGQTSSGSAMSVFAFVPAGSTYEVTGPNLGNWLEIV